MQIVLLVESMDKLPNSLIRHLIHSAKKKTRHAFDSFWESASENEIIIVSKAKEHFFFFLKIKDHIFTKKKDTTCDNPNDWCSVEISRTDTIYFTTNFINIYTILY